MADRLKDKVALVTGAGSIGPGWGNGKATAVQFAREGARVFAVDIRKEAVEETEGIIEGEGGTCISHVADVSDASAVAAAVETCLDAYGRVDVLHNNVGIVQVGGPEDISESEWDRLMNVNVKSMYLTCRHVLPHMVRQGRGSVINVSSIASFHSIGYPSVSYCASKGAVNALTRNIALHYAPKGVRCNAILPGLLNTPLIHASVTSAYRDPEEMVRRRNAQCPMGHMGDAWDVAHAAVFLASDEARYITSAQLVIDGSITLKLG